MLSTDDWYDIWAIWQNESLVEVAQFEHQYKIQLGKSTWFVLFGRLLILEESES